MVISEQFKSLNLNKKKARKLCTDEVGVVKMKKNARNCVLQFKKPYFLYCSFLAAPLALHIKDVCNA
jgi:hypothetical protein